MPGARVGIRKERSILALAGALVFASGSVACTRRDIDNAGNSIASAAPALASDGLIIAQIESKFVTIDGDSALHVAVASHDGVVRVTGKTKSAEISARYADAVKSTTGVKGESVALTVDPKLPSMGKGVADFALAAAVRANLLGQTGLNGIGLDVRSAGGVVTLRGRVKTSALHATLLAAARATKGVTSIVDELRVGS